MAHTHLVISEGDEGESPEGLRDEDVGDLPVLHEELPEVVGGHVLSAAADKHLPAPHRLVGALLSYGETDTEFTLPAQERRQITGGNVGPATARACTGVSFQGKTLQFRINHGGMQRAVNSPYITMNVTSSPFELRGISRSFH